MLLKGFFLDLSINVTELFRDPLSFKKIKKLLLETYTKRSRIKIWSAGCSSGEEIYSVSILLDKLGILDKSIIYATDFNSVILEEAKNGIYAIDLYNRAIENFKMLDFESSLDEYVTKNSNYITIDEKIRKKTNFFQHNLLVDGSFNEFDIIICKNVIIYFEEKLLEKVFTLLYTSLKFGGHLVLGEAEMIHPLFARKFKQCNKNVKVFKKVG